MSALPELMRRLDRKLDIQRGLSLSYDDLALLVASGAYAKLREATEDEERRNDLPYIPPARSDADPFIYFIQAADGGPIKIGHAKDVKKRRDALQIASHVQIKVLAATRAPQSSETALQCFFGAEHLRGEWFRPSPRLLGLIAVLNR